jgi:hypothetical protein
MESEECRVQIGAAMAGAFLHSAFRILHSAFCSGAPFFGRVVKREQQTPQIENL